MALTQIEPYALDSANSFAVNNLAVSGNINVTGNIVGNVSGNQPNITGLGTLSNISVTGLATFQITSDIITVIAGSTGVVNHDVTTGAVFYHSSPAASFTPNFVNVPVTNNRMLMFTLLISQGSTPYLPTAVQIEGSAQTIKWLIGTAPSGNASKMDIITFSLMRTSSSWTVLGQSSFYN